MVPELASRLSGSADIFETRGRRPWASVNFVTAHDGFTLHDLVSYNHKHNEANLEDNRDGTDNNYSWNCGEEGPSDSPQVLSIRRRQVRNFLATLLLSQGVPMLVAGDEFGRTQGGNNNAYCQDSPISWIDWPGIDEEGQSLVEFTQALIALRRHHIVFHRDRFFHGKPIAGTQVKDIAWLRPDGEEKRAEDWGTGYARFTSFLLSGEAGHYHLTARGEAQPDDTFLVILNASPEVVPYQIPTVVQGGSWETLIDTAADSQTDFGGVRQYHGGATLSVGAQSLVLLVRRLTEPDASAGDESPLLGR